MAPALLVLSVRLLALLGGLALITSTLSTAIRVPSAITCGPHGMLRRYCFDLLS